MPGFVDFVEDRSEDGDAVMVDSVEVISKAPVALDDKVKLSVQ